MNTQAIGNTWAALAATHCDYLDAVDEVAKRHHIKNITLYLGVNNEYKKLTLAVKQGKELTHEEINSFKARVASAVKFLKSL